MLLPHESESFLQNSDTSTTTRDVPTLCIIDTGSCSSRRTPTGSYIYNQLYIDSERDLCNHVALLCNVHACPCIIRLSKSARLACG